MWSLQESECHRKLLVLPTQQAESTHGHEDIGLTGSTKNVIEFHFLNHAKAPLVVIRLPELIVVFKSEDRHWCHRD